MSDPTFVTRLLEKVDVYKKKNHDYAGDLGTYFNFEYAAKIAEVFEDPCDKAFAVMIGIKLGRLAALKRKGKVPMNESVIDSHGDLTTYCGIWEAWEADTAEARAEARMTTAVESLFKEDA